MKKERLLLLVEIVISTSNPLYLLDNMYYQKLISIVITEPHRLSKDELGVILDLHRPLIPYRNNQFQR